jgi:hypothetical protein
MILCLIIHAHFYTESHNVTMLMHLGAAPRGPAYAFLRSQYTVIMAMESESRGPVPIIISTMSTDSPHELSLLVKYEHNADVSAL